ncbi:MAG: hypothetical protein ACOY4K_14170 [Pseudomonadota bacterium]
MAQARFSTVAAVADGFDFWRRDGLKAAGPLAVAAAAGAAAALQPDLQAATPYLAANVAAGVMAQAALYRIALKDAGGAPQPPNGPLGLQWRGLETRLIGLLLAAGLLLFAYVFVVSFAVALLVLPFGGLAPAPDGATPDQILAGLSPAARLAFNLGIVASIAGLVVLAARLSIAWPATAADGRIRFWSVFRLTRGSTAAILGAVLLVNLPVFAIQGLAWAYGQFAGAESGRWADIVGRAIATFYFVPIFVGMTSHIYLRLREAAPR